MPKPNLLVVDDEEDLRDFLFRALRRRFKVTRCENGVKALAHLEREHFEVLVTDHQMPTMSGVQLLETIGGRFPGLVRVLLTGHTDAPDVVRAIENAGIHNYIHKPVDSETLLAGIDAAYRALADRHDHERNSGAK